MKINKEARDMTDSDGIGDIQKKQDRKVMKDKSEIDSLKGDKSCLLLMDSL